MNKEKEFQEKINALVQDFDKRIDARYFCAGSMRAQLLLHFDKRHPMKKQWKDFKTC